MPYANLASADSNRPIKVLHVGIGMIMGGIETWIIQILRQNNRERIQMDFVVNTTDHRPYHDKVRALGSRIIPCPYTSNPWRYAYEFNRILRYYGPYDIIHSHLHYFNGYVLRLAKQAGIPIRIAHSHFDTSSIETHVTWSRRLYLTLTKQWIQQHATLGLGFSQKSMIDLFGSNWQADSRWQLLPYGISLEPFRAPVDSVSVRAELGIPQDAFVIGHVGRLVREKNHTFLLDVVAAVAQQTPKVHLLLIGEGVLQPLIQQQVIALGLINRVTFTSARSDVPQLMRGAMDVFLFPSLCEGLGLALVEAQAANLPCIVSDVIPVEADVVKPLICRLSLSQSPAEWAEALLKHCNSAAKPTPEEALASLEVSPFNLEKSIKQLESLYQSLYAESQIDLQKLCK